MFPWCPWGIWIFPGFCGSRRGLEGRSQCGPWRVCSAPLYQRAPYYFLPWGHSSSWPSPICLWGMGQRTCLSEYKPQKSFFNAPVGKQLFSVQLSWDLNEAAILDQAIYNSETRNFHSRLGVLVYSTPYLKSESQRWNGVIIIMWIKWYDTCSVKQLGLWFSISLNLMSHAKLAFITRVPIHTKPCQTGLSLEYTSIPNHAKPCKSTPNHA